MKERNVLIQCEHFLHGWWCKLSLDKHSLAIVTLYLKEEELIPVTTAQRFK